MKTKSIIKSIVILAMLATAFSGCKSFMKLKYGMAEPVEETPESLVAFLEKNSFPGGDMYMFRDTSSYFRAMKNSLFQKHFLSHMNFDRHGLLLVSDTAQCQWSGRDMIKTLHPDSSYKVLQGLQLEQILQQIKPFGRIRGDDSTELKADFTVIVTWAKFIGKYNYRLFELSDAVKENKASRIRLIWLNVDLQKSWHVTKQQKITFR